MLLHKKFMLIVIFLVSLLAVSAVSANDLYATDDLICEEISADDNLEIMQDDNLSTTYKVSGNTFEDIQNTIDLAKSGDTIELSGTYYGTGNEISINKAITIDGKGKATLDAKKLSRIFVIDNDNGFSLKNINFVNGNAGDGASCNGGAVFLGHVYDVEISGCTFKDNVARDGGAISASGNNVNVYDCNFINDRAFSEGYVTQGGAVRIGFDTHNYYFDNCSFINCSSGNSDPETNGAIYSEASNLYISNCKFANGFGGAIEVKKNTKIVNCNFINNSFIRDNVLYSGIPTVYLGGYGSNMSYCNFIDNVGSTMVAVYGNGGTLSNCDFRNNIIFSNVLEVRSYDECSIYGCNFMDNGYNYDYLPVISISTKLFSITSGYTNLTIGDIVIEDDANNVYGGAVTFENNILTITNSASAKGQITVRISDKTFTKSVNGGKTQFDLSSIKSGTYLTNIFYSGDDNEYKPSEMNIPITIKSNVEIKAADVSKYLGGSEKFTVKLTKDDKPLSGATVKVTVNGKFSFVKTDSNGKASIDLDLPVGTYNVVSSYDVVSTTSKFNVKSTITASDTSGIYSNSKVTATFLNVDGKALVSKRVTFKVNGKDYSASTNANGVATADIPLGVGTYTVTAINPANNEEKQFNLVISKASSQISLSSSKSNGVVTLTATLTPVGATGNVVFNINGENKYVAIKNAKATLTLKDLEAGSYKVTANYNGDNNLNPSASNAVTFTVEEVYPILNAQNLTKTYGSADKFVVNLIDNKGNAIANVNVNVDINSQITPITTDSNGQATMPVSLNPGKYTAIVTYENSQDTAKITVKKATPKITAKAKTFKKSDKTKKYTVTLKNNKKLISGATVKITVNKKTYTAKTKKGVATFKLKKLTKKGKYVATVKYTGSKYYNAAKSVKVKITVK